MSDKEQHDTANPLLGLGHLEIEALQQQVEELEPSATASTQESQKASRAIRKAILEAEKATKLKYPWLRHQNLLGMVCFTGSLFCMATVAWLFWQGLLGAWATVVLMALPISILHEIEHDLIHNLYFRERRWVQDVLFFVIWLSKQHSSPWLRREMHLKHHLHSGTPDDGEERLIGLGLPLGLKRMAVTVHPTGGILVTKDVARESTWLDGKRVRQENAPMMLTSMILTKLFLWQHCVLYFYPGFALYVPSWVTITLRTLFILFGAPNILRQACLVLMSNGSHYYGDIPPRDVFYQNQILDSWLVWPWQLFCCHFGASHIVHHFVPGQPFYLRLMLWPQVKNVMIRHGVRHNDMGIILRANRYHLSASPRQQRRAYWLGLAWFVLVIPVGTLSLLLGVFDAMVLREAAETVVMVLRVHYARFRTNQNNNNKKQQQKHKASPWKVSLT